MSSPNQLDLRREPGWSYWNRSQEALEQPRTIVRRGLDVLRDVLNLPTIARAVSNRVGRK